MDHAHAKQDFTSDEEEFADFNPLEAFDFDEDADDEDFIPGVLDEGPYNLPTPENAPQFAKVAFDSADTAKERIDTLFDQMPTLHRMLTDMLGYCLKPIKSDELAEAGAALQKHHHCIYSPLTLCNLLERAGALIQCDEHGTALKDLEQEPLKVHIDGADWWQVAPAPEIYWLISEDGRARYESYQPLEMLRELYEAEPHYSEIFTIVLRMCVRDGGTQVKDVDETVGDEPALQNPKRYGIYFIDKLERAGGVEWQNAWVTTEAGKQFLEAQKSTQ